MPGLNTTNAPSQIEDVTEQLKAALAMLRSRGSEIPIERARAIVACTSILIDTVRVETQQSAIHQEKP